MRETPSPVLRNNARDASWKGHRGNIWIKLHPKSTCPLKRDHLKGKVCLPNIIFQGRAFSLGVPISVVRLENIEKHIIPNGGFHGDESHGRR